MAAFLGQVPLRSKRLGQSGCCVTNLPDGSQQLSCDDPPWVSPPGNYPGYPTCPGSPPPAGAAAPSPQQPQGPFTEVYGGPFTEVYGGPPSTYPFTYPAPTSAPTVVQPTVPTTIPTTPVPAPVSAPTQVPVSTPTVPVSTPTVPTSIPTVPVSKPTVPVSAPSVPVSVPAQPTSVQPQYSCAPSQQNCRTCPTCGGAGQLCQTSTAEGSRNPGATPFTPGAPCPKITVSNSGPAAAANAYAANVAAQNCRTCPTCGGAGQICQPLPTAALPSSGPMPLVNWATQLVNMR